MSSEAGGRSDQFELADRLHSAAIHLLRSLRKEDAALGVSAARLSALSVLVFGGARTITELARAEQVKPPTISRLVVDLEAARLVRRVSDPEDRRVSRVEATKKGEALLHEGRRRRVKRLAKQVGQLDAAQLDILEKAILLVEEMLVSVAKG